MGLAADQALLTRLAQRLYDDLAADYDRHLVEACQYQTPTVVARALRELAADGALWLELGAGTGLVGQAVAAEGLALRLVASDLNPRMLGRATAAPYVGRVRVSALADLPFRAGGFDGALAAGLLEHVINPARLLAAAAPVLGPAGLFLFTYCPNRSGRIDLFDDQGAFVTHDEGVVGRCLETCGFEAVDQIDYPGYRDGRGGWITHRLVVAERRATAP